MDKKLLMKIAGVFLLCAIMVAGICLMVRQQTNKVKETAGHNISEENLLSPVKLPKETEKATKSPVKETKKENTIYSYLQGPKSWNKKRTWSGEWGVTPYDGVRFGAFGCGLCCIANLYSSLSPYRCTPVDAYYFSKKHTDYRGGGAIDWGYMKQALTKMGLQCELQKKPSSYQAFQKMVDSGEASIALISSNESKCYWKNMPGHYVTIFLYDKKTDKVFLADSGVPEHNRKWIPLKKVYVSLKTKSNWQILNVLSYAENKDTWKHKTANGNWIRE